jgi:hypothetical protein
VEAERQERSGSGSEKSRIVKSKKVHKKTLEGRAFFLFDFFPAAAASFLPLSVNEIIIE